MDPAGIEPAPPPCQGGVLPLDDGPPKAYNSNLAMYYSIIYILLGVLKELRYKTHKNFKTTL